MSLRLPYCETCDQAHWPPREICPHCLGYVVAWRLVSMGGRVLTLTVLHHSLAEDFRDHLPLHVATVQLDCGVRALVYLDGGSFDLGDRVTIASGKSPTGQDALVATSESH